MRRYTAVSEDGKSIGIFHMLDLLEEQDMTPADAGDLKFAWRFLNYELPVPHYPCGAETEAWFTDYGAEHFREFVEIIGRLIDTYLDVFGYSFHEQIRKEDSREIMYSVKYQTVFFL